ncbi:MAG: hypothetical protein PWQ39_1497 [Thermacetogenium sp.]|jgi:prefoldin subunit 5|nr:hypothetical protein [Thermacetogenium sp.]
MDVLVDLKKLQQVVESFGSNPLIEKTIRKLISLRKQELKRTLRHLSEEIKALEQRYQLSSSDFQKRYAEGALGDDVDLIKWASFLDMQQRVQAQLEHLEK